MIDNENEDGFNIPPGPGCCAPEPLDRAATRPPHGTSPDAVRDLIVTAITRHSTNSVRTAQSNDNRLGASEIGSCRNYLRHVIIGTERREETRVPWQAFIGTAVGDMLEGAMVVEHGVRTQGTVLATLPSGLTVPGHIDVFEPGDVLTSTNSGDWTKPGWVGDIKTKDGTRLIRDLSDVDRAHLFQVRLYHLALVQTGEVGPNAPAFLIYLDRSGKEAEPKVIEVPTGEEFITEIDEWLSDVVYAVKTGEEASRDRDYSWCEVACPFFWSCRGGDEAHANGALIEDESLLRTIKAYREGKAMEKEGKALADEARDALVGVAGTTPDAEVVSWTSIGGTTYEVKRAPYSRLNVRQLKQ